MRLRWALHVAGRRWLILSFGGSAVALEVSLTRVVVAPAPHRPLRPAAYLWEFEGKPFQDPLIGLWLTMAQKAYKLDRIVRRPA